MVSLRGRGYTRLSVALSDWLGSRGVWVSRMWALEESASAQKAARLHTDAALQHGIKMPGTAPLPRLLQVRQRQCKMFPKISMGTSAVWRESGLNVTERSATQEFVCCCHAAWLQASAKSASHHQSCPPRFAALCKQKTLFGSDRTLCTAGPHSVLWAAALT